jgi:hypothetical protein
LSLKSGATWTSIWRPLFGTAGQRHFLELNLISETLEFAPIPRPDPQPWPASARHQHVRGPSNTAFLVGTSAGPNAVAAKISAAFWIEIVAGEGGHPAFHQLRYSPLVILSFAGLSWPHMTVATLRKQSWSTCRRKV